LAVGIRLVVMRVVVVVIGVVLVGASAARIAAQVEIASAVAMSMTRVHTSSSQIPQLANVIPHGKIPEIRIGILLVVAHHRPS